MKDPNNDKDAESKRPPWRAVSISTLPKPDKNAILRAKLLDASRYVVYICCCEYVNSINLLKILPKGV